MLALVIGASSGIGRDMARILSKKGYDLILVARRKDRLEELKHEFKTKVTIFEMDVSDTTNCLKLIESLNNQKIDVLINAAGFGLYGNFQNLNILEQEQMVKTNVIALQNLCHLFINKFEKDKGGIILNIASFAAFYSGPYMACYYATKSYVYRLSLALSYELKKRKSPVKLSVLCPGPTKTEFQNKANVHFTTPEQESEKVAKIGIEKMGKKRVIFTSVTYKILRFLSHFISDNLAMHLACMSQKRKR